MARQPMGSQTGWPPPDGSLVLSAHSVDVLAALAGPPVAGLVPVHQSTVRQLRAHRLAELSPDGLRLSITDLGRQVHTHLTGEPLDAAA